MGAVQKLATVVIIGLVALATILTVYIADEPNRRGGETTEQDVLAIERGTELYVQYCLQCHGPSGLGAAGGDGRIGGVLNQEAYQSDDPSIRSQREDWAHFRITYGFPAETLTVEKKMPAFGTELNVEEVNDLVYMIMNVDWNYVYNESVITTGENQEAACAATPDTEGCGELTEAGGVPVAYPTAPATAVPAGQAAAPAASPAAGGAAPAAEIDASDANAWSVTEVTAKAGDTIAVNNPGVIAHDFTVDEWSINDPLAGGAQTTITIPADAAPGTYTFYCSVPGHREAGMEGTITIEG